MFKVYNRAINLLLIALIFGVGSCLILIHEKTHNPPDISKTYWLGPNLEETLNVTGVSVSISEKEYQEKVKETKETWVKVERIGSTLTNLHLWLIGDAVYDYSFPLQAPGGYYSKTFEIQDGLLKIKYKHARFYLAMNALWFIGFVFVIASVMLVKWKFEEDRFTKKFIKEQEEKNKLPDEFFDELLERTSKL